MQVKSYYNYGLPQFVPTPTRLDSLLNLVFFQWSQLRFKFISIEMDIMGLHILLKGFEENFSIFQEIVNFYSAPKNLNPLQHISHAVTSTFSTLFWNNSCSRDLYSYWRTRWDSCGCIFCQLQYPWGLLDLLLRKFSSYVTAGLVYLRREIQSLEHYEVETLPLSS